MLSHISDNGDIADYPVIPSRVIGELSITGKEVVEITYLLNISDSI